MTVFKHCAIKAHQMQAERLLCFEQRQLTFSLQGGDETLIMRDQLRILETDWGQLQL